jgi:CheY-like chemotaxis protein
MSPSNAPGASAPRPSILLIDDDAISREVLSMLLEMDGYAVGCAEDGEQALDGIVASNPEVVLMDTQMPGLSGLDLISALRAKSQARIVAISGSDPGESIHEAADGFLLKPIQPEDLEALLSGNPAQPAGSNHTDLSISASADTGSPQPAINPQVLGKLQAMMPAAAVREIYAAVATDLGPRLDSLEAAMDAKDAQSVARIAHAVKGGCSMVGLTAATDAAARLESSNRIGAWPEELIELRSALAALQSILVHEFPT